MRHTAYPADSHGSLAPPRAPTVPILVASDGAPSSAPAFLMAQELAERAGAAVHVVSVLEPTSVIIPPIDRPHPPTQEGASRTEQRRTEIADLVRHAAGDGPAWSLELETGQPIASITRIAHERNAALVITGRTHHGSVERIVRRETPLAIARAARLPVLSVPRAAPRLPRCIVVAVGLGDAAIRLGRVADALFRDAIAVHLVHVSPPELPRHERALREELEADDDSIRRAFARTTDSWHLPADVSVATHVLTGHPMDELTSFADAVAADLVVVGLPARTAGLHLPHRSLAARLYREMSCALLIVPVGDEPAVHRHDGTDVSAVESEWPALLAEFARQNAGQPVSLTVDDRIGGAQIVARRRPLGALGYDVHAHAVVVTLLDASDPQAHLTHRIAHPLAIAVHRRPGGVDDALVVGYDGGQMLITLDWTTHGP